MPLGTDGPAKRPGQACAEPCTGWLTNPCENFEVRAKGRTLWSTLNNRRLQGACVGWLTHPGDLSWIIVGVVASCRGSRRARQGAAHARSSPAARRQHHPRRRAGAPPPRRVLELTFRLRSRETDWPPEPVLRWPCRCLRPPQGLAVLVGVIVTSCGSRNRLLCGGDHARAWRSGRGHDVVEPLA